MSESEKSPLEALLTKEKFLAWVRTQDPAGRFEFTDTLDCAIARYLKANNVAAVSVGHDDADGIIDGTFMYAYLPGDLQNLVHNGMRPARTFGEIVEQADKPQETDSA